MGSKSRTAWLRDAETGRTLEEGQPSQNVMFWYSHCLFILLSFLSFCKQNDKNDDVITNLVTLLAMCGLVKGQVVSFCIHFDHFVNKMIKMIKMTM